MTIPRILTSAFLATALLVSSSEAQTAPRAGEIRALIPNAYLVRAGSPQREVQKQDAFLWQDILRTDRGGRIRAALDDGSILNVGSESQLQIVRHDARQQRTELQLAYGKLRANVVRITRPSGGFDVRTPVAVAGVVGTRFFVKITADGFVIVLAMEDRVRVRNIDPSVVGEVILNPGEYTTVARGVAPATPAPAPPDLLREAEDDLDIPVPDMPFTRIELSWPPAACGKGTAVLVRAWTKETKDGKEIESPVDPELISGTLAFGSQTLRVEGGQGNLPDAVARPPQQGTFTPKGRAPLPAKVWDPVEMEASAGGGWRAPRATFAGSAFAVQGPMTPGIASFSFGGQPAQLLWQGACGAGFLSPAAIGREYDVELALSGKIVARGKMNLISFSYRIPNPPAIVRGQPATFGIDILGLENLQAHTAGRPVMVTTLINTTPAIIGNLRSSTPGAKSSGETIVYTINGPIPPGGVTRLEGIGTGRMKGAYSLDVNHLLDPELRLPRTPMQLSLIHI